MKNASDYIHEQALLINKELDRILPPETCRPTPLHQAMRYSVFAGGKRLRPALCIAACESCGGSPENALAAACSLEILHTYTLIHDDLPAMDDDTLRRGHPTCHIQFDEATAILAGDALLTFAFEVLANVPNIGSQLVLELARSSGSCGVIGGQAEDLAAEGQTADASLVDYIHRNKTAALIRSSCVMGGLCAGASAQTLEHLAQYGENVGLAFQLVDDLLDETSTTEVLGKDIGSDKAKGKMTYPSVHGAKKTREQIKHLTKEACDAAKQIALGDQILIPLAQEISDRSS